MRLSRRGTLAVSRGVPGSPDSLPNLRLWLDASQITGLADGATVNTWDDVSGGGRNASRAAGTPTYRTNVVNSKPVVRMPSGCQFNVSSVIPGTAGTILAVLKTLVHGHGDIAQTGLWRLGGASGFSHYPFQDGLVYETAGTSSRYNFNPGGSLAVWHVYTIVADTNNWRAYRNGVERHASGSNTPSWSGTFSVGNDGGIYFNGDMAEMVAYSEVLSTTNRQAVESYLMTKYGIV